MKCIFCLKEVTPETRSRDHVPPEYLGGFLLLPFVCRSCNSTFGHTIEADLGKNAFIIAALDKLGLKFDKRELYRHAEKSLQNPNGKKLKAIVDKSGKPKVRCQNFNDGSQVMPDDEAVSILRKILKRRSRKTGTEIPFDPKVFEKAKPGELISIPESRITFKKHTITGGSRIIEWPKGPIPFRVIGKIVFEHLAGLDYSLVLRREFDPIRKWILGGGEGQFVFLYRLLRGKKPQDLQYKPFHYILLRFKDHYFTAIVSLFSTLSFYVFLSKMDDIKNDKLLETIKSYHIYDLRKRMIFTDQAPPEHRNAHNEFMDAQIYLRKYQSNV